MQYIRPDTVPLPAALGHHHVPLQPAALAVQLPPDRVEVQPAGPPRGQVEGPADRPAVLLPAGHHLPHSHQATPEAQRCHSDVDGAGGDDTLQHHQQV